MGRQTAYSLHICYPLRISLLAPDTFTNIKPVITFLVILMPLKIILPTISTLNVLSLFSGCLVSLNIYEHYFKNIAKTFFSIPSPSTQIFSWMIISHLISSTQNSNTFCLSSFSDDIFAPISLKKQEQAELPQSSSTTST